MYKKLASLDGNKRSHSVVTKKVTHKINDTEKEVKFGKSEFRKKVKNEESAMVLENNSKFQSKVEHNVSSTKMIKQQKQNTFHVGIDSKLKGHKSPKEYSSLGKREYKAVNYRENKRNHSNKGDKEDKEERNIPKDVKRITNSKLSFNGKKVKKKDTDKMENKTFPCHIPKLEIEALLKNQSSTNVQYVEGYLHVIPRCYTHAYLPLDDDKCDLLIVGFKDRNRAFDGDFVVACINPPEMWHSYDGNVRKTGVIVHIKEAIHPRKAVGYLKKHGMSTFIYPRDCNIPLIKIDKGSLKNFIAEKKAPYDDTLYLASITDWQKPQFAIGKIDKLVGKKGDIKAESNAILLQHDLDVTPFSEDVLNGLPKSDYTFTETDTKDREDWRKECVFTIDPATAADLDDAVSCKLLENGNYEIGVHISDVTHYLKFLSPLDNQVSKRATTVYMADNVYHMLPKQLCQLCSLLPGRDKLTFSVVWEITQDAEVVRHRFAKTIINSCCQMSYKHAQEFINNPKNDWPNDFLRICGDFTFDDLSKTVNMLHNLAMRMRSRRFENGALQIDQPKFYMKIDRLMGLPTSYKIEEREDSNRLIEEFMLLANMTVARHLYHTLPNTALLRNHKEPSKQILNVTRETLQKFGIHLDIDSSASLHASIKRYGRELEAENEEIKAVIKNRMMVINKFCAKAMSRATYRCSSTINTEAELRHYALNVSLYTHFTSPIRRYPDCVVHRLLYSTMQNAEMPDEWSDKLCKRIAANCNHKKYNAKLAQERSNELYFVYLIDLHGSMLTGGIVFEVGKMFIDVLICDVGVSVRIFVADLKKLATVKYFSEYSVPTISISWNKLPITQEISTFTSVYLKLEKHPETFRIIGTILPPKQNIKL